MSKNNSRSRAKHLWKTIKYILKNPFTYIWILIFIIIGIATVVVYKSETQTESGIETMFDSVWFTLVAVFAAYFDYCVKSVPGRMSALLLLVFGMLLFSAVTGKLASYFTDLQMQKNKGLRKLRKMRGHFLLCGWRPGFEKILDSVLNSNPDITPDMIVLVNDAAEQIEQVRSQVRFKELNYVAGDFADEATLKRAQIENAERALVICDRSKSYSDLEIDSRTVLAVLTMENINPGIYIAAELIDAKFQKHLELAHCDEIILTQDYEHSLLATASSGMGYSNVIRALISDDADTGILVEDIPQSFIGKTYGEYEAHIEKTDPANGVLVGLLLNTGNFHQRRKDALREAQKNPDIKKIVDNLKKVKTLKSNKPVLTPPDDYVIQRNTKAIIVRG
ncbi:MAG: NAD-binding protein [Treponema sp.]|nr:NAD-binding protein [Treponema sp.]